MSKKVQLVKSEYDLIRYEHFAKIYLLISKSSLLIWKNYQSNNELSNDDKWRYESGMIFIPIIYNIKHSIELFLKSLFVKNLGKYPETHDLKYLGQKVLVRLPKIKNSNFFNLIEKYSKYTVLESSKWRTDNFNELFRYPDNKIGSTLKGENLNKIDGFQMLEDIKILKSEYTRISILNQT